MALGEILAGLASKKLLPALKAAGANILARIVEKQFPGGGQVVSAISGALGVATNLPPVQQAKAIAAAYERDPEEVKRIIQKVEVDNSAQWEAMAQMIDTTHETIRQEYKASSWLIQHWRPIFAMMYIVTTPILIAMHFWLVFKEVPDASNFGQVLIFWLPIGGAVLGVYVNGRSKEKIEGVN